MLKYSEIDAANFVEKMTMENIKSTDKWVQPEDVTYFMEEVYKFLSVGNEDL